MYYSNAISEIVQAIDREVREPVVVGIDGRSGAGKSTLAGELAQRLANRTALIEGDDFYRDVPEAESAVYGPEQGYDRYFDWERLRSEVLMPIRNGVPRIGYRRYDWDQARLGDLFVLDLPPVVVVEGVFTLRPQLRGLIDITVYVETDTSTRYARQIARGENSAEWISRWAAAEQYYIEQERPERVAELVIQGA